MSLKLIFERFVAAVSAAAIVIQPVLAQTVVTAPDGTNLDAGSGNGVPLIMIAPTNPGGVSHNVFDQFNVGAEGLILNNNGTTGVVNTGLGGLIIPNPNITGAPASLILNEVTGVNASAILGMIEIGGTQADLVIANPYGITCNGCGFINTGNLTLTTGTPTWEGSNFTGLSVDRGTIEIGANGADAAGALTFGLISRQLVVGGTVTGQDIRVTLGRNDVVYATGQVTEKADDGSTKPALAIDSTLVGGMYANSISILSTEDGVGARMPQNMAASAGEMQITADGRLIIRPDAVIVAEGDVTLNADEVTSAGRIAASGGTLRIDAVDGIFNTGIAYGETGLRFRSDGVIENDGGTLLTNGNLTLAGLVGDWAGEVRNLDGAVIETISGNIVIAADSILNARPDPLINGVTASEPDAGGFTCPLLMTCDTTSYDPDAGLPAGVTLQGEAAQIVSGGNITLNGTSAQNRYSLISAAGNVVLNLTTLENIGLGLYATTADPTMLTQVGAVFGTIEAAGVIDANVSGYILNGAVAGNTTLQSGTGVVNPADLISDLTSNGLFVPTTDPNAPYLIETRPEFVNPELFLSSDYFLIAVGLDPAAAQKRMGDAYAELLYIRKQLLALAGMLRLQPGLDEVEQIKLMYDNAVDAAAELNLTVGVALTPEQQAALKTDIVWLEEVEVNGQMVLAPRVYLADTTRITLAGGAILRGAVIDADTGDFTNTGTVFAEGSIRINASGALLSTGRIEGGNVILAGNSIEIATGSDRRGDDVAFADGAYGQAAVISHRDLVMTSANDLVIAGARIEAGNNAALLAGGTLNITAQLLESRRGKPTGRNHYRVEVVNALTSSIRAGGDIALIAEGEGGMLLQGAEVEAGRALMMIARRGDLVLASVADIRYTDYARRSGSFLSRKTVRHQVLTIDNLPTRLSATQIGVVADGAILGQATSFNVPGGIDEVAGDLAVLSVNGGVAFNHVTDIEAEHYYKKRAFLGGLITNSYDVRTLATIARGSSGQISGDMLINSGADLTLTAVSYEIGGEFRTQVAGATYVLSAVEMAYRAVVSHKDNGVIVTDHRSETITETARHNWINAEGGVTFDPNSPIIIAGVRDARFEGGHPGGWMADGEDGRMALATSYLNPSEPETGEPGEADPSWREDLAWASEGDLTLTMMELPGAEDGAGFAYIPGLLARETTEVIPTEMIAYHFSETKRSISPAFKVLVTIVVTQGMGLSGALNLAGNLKSVAGFALTTTSQAGVISLTAMGAAVNAAAVSSIMGLAEGVVSGDLDLGNLLEGAAFSGLTAGLTNGINAESFGVEWGTPPKTGLLGFGDDLTWKNIAEAGLDAGVKSGLSAAVYGESFGQGFSRAMGASMLSFVLADSQSLIGDKFDEGSFGNAAMHGLAGCAFAEASGGDCRAGLAAGVAQSLYAGTIDRDAPGYDREAALNTAELIGAFTGYAFSGGRAENVSAAGSTARSGFENNYLTHAQFEQLKREMDACLTDECRREVYDKYVETSAEQQHQLAMCGNNLACQAPHLQAMMEARSHELWQAFMAPSFRTHPLAALELQAHQAYLGFAYSGTTVTPDASAAYARYPEWAANNCAGRSGAECIAGFQGEVNKAAFRQGLALGWSAFTQSAFIGFAGGVTITIAPGAVANARLCAANPACWAEMTALAGDAALGVSGATAGQTFFTIGAVGTVIAGRLVLQHGDQIVGVVDDLGRVLRPLSQTTDEAGRFVVQTADGVTGYLDDAGRFVPDGVATDRVRELFSQRPTSFDPMNAEQFAKIQEAFARQGKIIDNSEDALRYLEARGADGVTFNADTVLLRPNANPSTVFEELIHTAQHRTGLYNQWVSQYGNVGATARAEYEAATRLVRNQHAYGISNADNAINQARVQEFGRQLDEMGIPRD